MGTQLLMAKEEWTKRNGFDKESQMKFKRIYKLKTLY